SRRARHRGVTHRNHQLWGGAACRPGIRGKRVVAEPSRRVLDHLGRTDAQKTMRRWTTLAPATFLLAGACVATKGDIRLLQDELRATRAAITHADSVAALREQARRADMAAAAA